MTLRTQLFGDREENPKGKALVNLVIGQSPEIWNVYGESTTANSESIIDFFLARTSWMRRLREGKSTTTALNEVLEGVEMGLNKDAWVLLVALDIDGAFNSMNWNRLMRNLMDMGCPDNLCSLVCDFLRDRRISLSFGGLKLEINRARGCPEGSCCGPILWNILVKTVFQEELPEGARLVLYADDQAWWCRNRDQKVATTLERVQRTAALRITEGYRTTSTEALLVLAGLIPLGLKLEEEAIRQKIWENREDALGLEAGALEWKRDPRKPLQWLPKWNWSPGVPTGIGTEVFTDGSKSGTNTGAGVVIFTNRELIFQESLTLRVDELVFSAEMVAIREALRVCAEKNFSPDSLYSECMSALVGINLEKEQLAHQIIQELEMITLAPGLHWVRGPSLIEECSAFSEDTEVYSLSSEFEESVEDTFEENFLMKKWIKTSQVLGKLAWKDTTLDEMMAFIGVIFNMGNVKKNQIRDYWSKNELFETPWFGKVMPSGRFELLYSYFSLIDDFNLVPSSHPDYNPTARFEKLIEHVNNKFIYYYKPTQNLTDDESLVCLKNRTRLRQYMPQKHHGRFGVKLWMLCESKTGYCLRMKPYKGKLSPIIKSLSYDVPMNLLQEFSLLGKGYHLITDNFFTSINLAKDLLDSHTYLTGTIRTNRKGLPKTLTSAKLGVDESLYMVNNNLLALAYKEKKSKPPVKFLSTFCDASSGKKKVSDQRDYPQKIMKICYDSYMGGVDLNDQMLYTYMDERKGRKFYRKHTKDNPKLSRRAFNYSVINELVKNHLKPPVLPSTSQEVLEKLPEKRESRCVECTKEGLKRRKMKMARPAPTDPTEGRPECQEATDKMHPRTSPNPGTSHTTRGGDEWRPNLSKRKCLQPHNGAAEIQSKRRETWKISWKT
ncbi:ZKSCAN1 [Cordylochernes scorpioides]|uniref:ZKSCAN1 n=1 Tax=Cordylochernes scorpioides TaxID=51811 RepID=A0ABY6KW52_9ARAC|nr:ZKSCAN1 [Cordylochernes scorpioides]